MSDSEYSVIKSDVIKRFDCTINRFFLMVLLKLTLDGHV